MIVGRLGHVTALEPSSLFSLKDEIDTLQWRNKTANVLFMTLHRQLLYRRQRVGHLHVHSLTKTRGFIKMDEKAGGLLQP